MKANQIIQVPLKLISSSQHNKIFEDIKPIVSTIKKEGFLLPISMEQLRQSYQHITVENVKELQVKAIGFFTDKK
jgi:hypothetical protein